jgi:outer membrane protein assembly factor BamB
MGYSVRGKTIRLENKRTRTFAFPIGDVIEIEGTLVICLKIPMRRKFNENVFAIDREGTLLWQVEPKPRHVANSPYVGLTRQGRRVRLHNFDGMIYDVDPKTGAVVWQLLAK